MEYWFLINLPNKLLLREHCNLVCAGTTLVWKWILCSLLFAATILLLYQFLDLPVQMEIPNNLFAFDSDPLSKEVATQSSSTISSSMDGNKSCPEYFSWIHEDLRPWKKTGITKEMVESAIGKADFRMIIVDGKLYIKTYRRSFQTRDILSQWGIVQLLKLFPGKLPDIDLMFDCSDMPQVRVQDYYKKSSYTKKLGTVPPPPLFHYCADKSTMDIVFPDWSFWGWPEVNVKPWVPLLEEIKEANKKVTWEDRDPFAYWKGNAYTSSTRTKLLTCNGHRPQDWNARIYEQNWDKEWKEGFKHSNLADQCSAHRYGIYADGRSWSASKKYIMACDSTTLIVKPTYYDFFTRSLIPLRHYWPIREDHICLSIKFAVSWGNVHSKVAKSIGELGSRFIEEQVKMDYVYDYMFHLLNEYGKLLRYKPIVPENEDFHLIECMDCVEQGLLREFMNSTMVNKPRNGSVCNLPPPFGTKELQAFESRKAYLDLVKSWERHSIVV